MTALSSVQLKIDDSGIYGVLGANGAGKTTLLLIISNLIKRYQGTYSLRQNSNKIYMGFLPENWNPYPNLSAYKQVELFYKLRACKKPNKDVIYDNLQWSGLEKKFWNRNPNTFSKGMKQRLGLAIAFTANPEMIILDEPLAHLDPLGRQDLLRKIQRY